MFNSSSSPSSKILGGHQQAGISRPGWHQKFRGTPAGRHQPARVASKIPGDTSRLAPPAGQGGIKNSGDTSRLAPADHGGIKNSGDTSRLAPAGQGGIKSFGGHQQAGTSRTGWHQNFRGHQVLTGACQSATGWAGLRLNSFIHSFGGTSRLASTDQGGINNFGGHQQAGISRTFHHRGHAKSWKIAPCVDLAWFRVYSTGTDRLQGSFISGLSGGIPGTFRWNLPSLVQWASVP